MSTYPNYYPPTPSVWTEPPPQRWSVRRYLPSLPTRPYRAPAKRTPAKPAPVKKDVKKKPKPQPDVVTKSVSDVWATICSAVTKEPTVPIIMLLAAYLVVSHTTDPTKSVVASIVASLEKNPATVVIATWIKENAVRVIGVIVNIPVIYAVSPSKRSIVAVVVAFVTLLLPASQTYGYVVQASALYLYFQVRDKNTKFVLIAFVAVVYFLGHFDAPVSTSPSTPKQGK